MMASAPVNMLSPDAAIAPRASKLRPSAVRFLALAVLVAWSGWLAWEYLAYGRLSYIRQHDTAEVNTSYYTGLPRLASDGRVGSWHPVALAGADARANIKGEPVLIEALFRWWPHWSNSGVLLFTQTLIAAVGMLVLARRRLASDYLAATLAAAAFSFNYTPNLAYSGFPTWYGLFVPGLPFLLLALGWSCARGPWTAATVAALAGVVMALGSLVVLSAFLLPVAAYWLLVVERRRPRSVLAVFGVFVAVFLALKAPVIAALLTTAADSHRTLLPRLPYGTPDDIAFQARRVAEASAMLRDHQVVLWCAVAGWLAGGYRRRALNALLLALAAVALELRYLIPLRELLRSVVPSLASFQLDRFTYFVPFLAAAAGAAGLAELGSVARRIRWTAPRWIAIALLWCVGASIGLQLLRQSTAMNAARELERRNGSNYASFYRQPVLNALAAATAKGEPFRVVTFAEANNGTHGEAPAYAWAYGLETADGYLNAYPLRFHEFWARVIAPAAARREDIREYFYQWGNRADLFSPYAPLLKVAVFDDPAPVARHIFNLDLLSLANVRYVISAVALQDDRLRLWDGNRSQPAVTPVTTIARGFGRNLEGAVVKQRFVYENPGAFPRFFVASAQRVVEGRDAALDAVTAADPATLHATAIVERALAGVPDEPSGVGLSPPVVQVRSDTADRIELTASASGPSVLVATNTYSPHWRATVNRARKDVFVVNGTFQGVQIDAGSNQVVLEYSPPYAVSAWTLAVATVVVWLAGAGMLARLARREATRDGTRRHRVVLVAATLLLIGVVAVATAVVRTKGEAPWLDGWRFRVAMTAVGGHQTMPLRDLPVLVRRGPDAAEFWTHVEATGRDLRFTDARGTLLPFELEAFDREAKQMHAWVKLPTVNPAANEPFYLYYGNAAAERSENAAAVWAPDYSAVWHMSDGDPALVRDSTGHGFHARTVRPDRSTRVPGIAGSALRLDGVKDRAALPDSTVVAFGTSDWMMELWVRPPELLKGRAFNLLSAASPETFDVLLHPDNFLFLGRKNGTATANAAFYSSKFDPGAWTHVAIRRAGNLVTLAMNGDFVPAAQTPLGFSDPGGPVPFMFGWGDKGGFEGVLDEIRIRRGAAPSGEWMRASYEAQAGTLVRYGRHEAR